MCYRVYVYCKLGSLTIAHLGHAQSLIDTSLQLFESNHEVHVALAVLFDDIAHVVGFARLLKLASRHEIFDFTNHSNRFFMLLGKSN